MASLASKSLAAPVRVISLTQFDQYSRRSGWPALVPFPFLIKFPQFNDSIKHDGSVGGNRLFLHSIWECLYCPFLTPQLLVLIAMGDIKVSHCTPFASQFASYSEACFTQARLCMVWK